ncbi:MAG: SLC13 family permease [Planctomycetota bacterium]|nr:SLC13 family permease [Planctomycetota bacterium]
MVGNNCRIGFLFSCLIFFGLQANVAPTNVFGQEETSETASATNGADAAAAITNDSESVVEVGGAAIPQDPSSKSEASSVETSSDTVGTYPLVVLAIGIVAVLVLIIGFKINAFIALISAAMLVSVLAPGNIETKSSRVATSSGSTAGGIAIVIALAAVIGKCMLDSGAADRIVRAFLNLFGEKRSPIALLGSGFVLAIPVFFDTVFYLLVPLARSLFRRTHKNYLKYILAIGAGGAITHTLVPPTPGPLLMASNLNIDVGLMILIGLLVALPAAAAGLLFAQIADRVMPIPMRSSGNEEEPVPLEDNQLPSLAISLAPVLLPVFLISISTVASTVADQEDAARLAADQVLDWNAWGTYLEQESQAEGDNPSKLLLERPELSAATKQWLLDGQNPTSDQEMQAVEEINSILRDKDWYRESAFLGLKLPGFAKKKVESDNTRMKPVDATRMNRELLDTGFQKYVAAHEWNTTRRVWSNRAAFLGNANFALLLSTIIAMITLVKQRGLSRSELAASVETALMSGGVIILITAGGAAFGGMLAAAQIGPAIQEMFSGSGQDGMTGMAFLILGFSLAAVLKVAQGSSTVAMIVGSGMVAAILGDASLGFNPVYVATAVGSGSCIGSWMNDSGFWIFAKMGGLTEGEALKTWTPLLCVMGIAGFLMSLLLSQVLPLVG